MLVSMKNHVFLLACNVRVMRCTALLCRAMRFLCLLSMGVRMLIRGGIIYICLCDNTVYNWGFDV